MFPGLTAPATGSYTEADAAPGYSGEYRVAIGDYDLCSASCADAMGQTASPQGMFNLTFTDPGPSQTSGNGGVFWTAPHGTVVISMPARPNGSQSGTLIANVTF